MIAATGAGIGRHRVRANPPLHKAVGTFSSRTKRRALWTKIDAVLHLRDFVLERLDEDEAIVGFAKRAAARIAHWLDFAKGALLMLMVPGDPESGFLYICMTGP